MVESNIEMVWECVNRYTGEIKHLGETEAFDLDQRLWHIEVTVSMLGDRPITRSFYNNYVLAPVLCVVPVHVESNQIVEIVQRSIIDQGEFCNLYV